MSKSKKAMFLQEWKEQVGTNMEHFHEGAALMVRKHQKSSQKTTAFAATLHEMSQHELCPSIKAALESLSSELSTAEAARTQLLAQLQAHVVNEFSKYPHKLRVQDVNIRARNKAYEKFVKKQKAFVATKGLARPEKQQHAREVFEHERQRLHSAEQTLNSSLAQFETARVREMQAMLKKYISSQIHFFSRSIEGLTAAYARVCEIDCDREGERLVEEMRKLEVMEQKDDHGGVAGLDAVQGLTTSGQQPQQPGSPAQPTATEASGSVLQQQTGAIGAGGPQQQPQLQQQPVQGQLPYPASGYGYAATGSTAAASPSQPFSSAAMQSSQMPPMQQPSPIAATGYPLPSPAAAPIATAITSTGYPYAPQPAQSMPYSAQLPPGAGATGLGYGQSAAGYGMTAGQSPQAAPVGGFLGSGGAAAGGAGYGAGYGYGNSSSSSSGSSSLQSLAGSNRPFSANGYTLSNVDSRT